MFRILRFCFIEQGEGEVSLAKERSQLLINDFRMLEGWVITEISGAMIGGHINISVRVATLLETVNAISVFSFGMYFARSFS